MYIIYKVCLVVCTRVCVCVSVLYLFGCVFHVLQVSRLRFVYNFEVRVFGCYIFFLVKCYLQKISRERGRQRKENCGNPYSDQR